MQLDAPPRWLCEAAGQAQGDLQEGTQVWFMVLEGSSHDPISV